MRELVFTYNADSGIANALIDYGKKYLAPGSYDCQLCMLSYGPFGMKRDWKKFIESLDADVRFLHKDEFESEFPDWNVDHPSLIDAVQRRVLISSNDFANISSMEDLKTRVSKVL
ncbi:MAG: hypothetical protein AAF413_03130 [Patescibacteria group bacterium]